MPKYPIFSMTFAKVYPLFRPVGIQPKSQSNRFSLEQEVLSETCR